MKYKLFGRNGELEDIEGALLGLRALQFLDATLEWGDELYAKRGLKTPPQDTSTMIFIDRCGPLTVSDIVASTGHSHQYMTKRINTLIKHGLIARTVDRSDKRRKLLKLTPIGKKEIKHLVEICQSSKKVYAKIGKELGVDLTKVLETLKVRISQEIIKERTTLAAE